MCNVIFDSELLLLQGVCAAVECSENLLYRNGTCGSRYLLDPPTRYLYSLTISATPFDKNLLWGSFISNLAYHVIRSINTSLPSINTSLPSMKTPIPFTQHVICKLSAYIPVTSQTFIRSVYMDVDMNVPIAHKSLRNFLSNLTLREFNLLDNSLRTYTFKATLSLKRAFSCPPGVELYCKSNIPSFSRFIKVFSESYKANSDLCATRLSNPYVVIEKMLICPKLCIEHFYSEEVNSKNRQLCFTNSSICFGESDYILTNSKLCVCKDDYISKLHNRKKRDKFKGSCQKPPIPLTEAWITFIGTIISNISLAATIIVYLCIPQLRTLPGKNNLVLSAVILAAQLCYHYGGSFTDSPILCKVIGGLAHYLWMAMFLWMNVCTFPHDKSIHFYKQIDNLATRTNCNICQILYVQLRKSHHLCGY